MTTISKERRDAIRAAAEKATPGPWEVRRYAGTSSYRMLLAERGKTMYAECIPADTAAHLANCDPQTILALLDALDAAEARPVAVKPLEWEAVADQIPKHAFATYTPFKRWLIVCEFLSMNHMVYRFDGVDYETLTEAKAAAQADYEARIRSALQEPKK